MSEPAPQDIRAEAVAWRIRLREGTSDDWDAFIRWLEADPNRSDAYDVVASADRDLSADAIPPPADPLAANDEWNVADAPERRNRTGYWATAFAAVAALFLVGLIAIPWFTAEPNRYEIATAAGERRNVPIGDGSSVALNGGTRLILDRDNPRYAELAAGEATFTVRHDSGRPFQIVAGAHRLQDVGTAFNVIHDRDRFSVEVIEGAVLYNPSREAVTLNAGQTLLARAGDGGLTLGRREPQAMAGWRQGQLSYRGTPIETVARDLSRSLGVEVVADPQIAALPFTGSIRMEGGADATLARFASMQGLGVRRTGNRWHIEPQPRARR